MKSKDQLLLEQAYQSIREKDELALQEPKRSNPLKRETFELSIGYADQSEVEEDQPKSKQTMYIGNTGEKIHSLDRAVFVLQDKLQELYQAGKFWCRIRVSKHHMMDGSTAQLTDINNIISLVENRNHILWQCWGPEAKKGTVPIKGKFADMTKTLLAFGKACDALEAQYPSNEYD